MKKLMFAVAVNGVAFDGVLILTLLKKVVSSGVDNSLSYHADNFTKFLMLGEVDTFGINGSFVALESKFSVDLS